MLQVVGPRGTFAPWAPTRWGPFGRAAVLALLALASCDSCAKSQAVTETADTAPAADCSGALWDFCGSCPTRDTVVEWCDEKDYDWYMSDVASCGEGAAYYSVYHGSWGIIDFYFAADGSLSGVVERGGEPSRVCPDGHLYGTRIADCP